MSLRAQYKTDAKKEAEGIVVKRDANPDGTIPQFRLAFMGRTNKAYSRALEVATRPHRQAIENRRMNNEVAEDIFLDVFLNTVLKGWDNILMSDVTGNAEDKGYSPFNKANAKMLFTQLPFLYEELQDEAKNMANFKEEQLEAEAKN